MLKKTLHVAIGIIVITAVCPLAAAAQNVFPANGPVGIGTNSPQQALDVKGSTLIETNNDPVLIFNNFDNSWQYMEYKRNNVRQAWMGLTDGNDFYMTKETPGSLVLHPVSGDVLLSPYGGRVGINTLTPTGHLSFATMGNNITMGIPSWPNQVMVATGWNGTNGDFIDLRVPGALANTAVLRLQQNGNVGIGTENPGTFKLAVEGKIGARGIKVTLQNPFPDYVFEPAYKLRSLASLQEYINQNKHLPGIPSAEEVKKDGGIELGDMNVKLLEKVEELTLYVLELKKEIETLKMSQKK